MSQFIIDLLFSSIFALLVILLIKVKEKTFNENKDSYNYTLGGLAALAFSSLLQLAGHQNLFTNVPFLEEAMYQELLEVIGIVAGVAMMIAGITIWLPAKKKRDNAELMRIKKHESFEKIQRVLDTTADAGHAFSILPDLLNQQLGILCSAVFRYSHRSKRFICTNCLNLTDERKNSLEKNAASMVTAGHFFEKSRSLAEYAVPITVGGGMKAVLFFWGKPDSPLGPDEKLMLDRIGKIFSIMIMEQFGALKKSFYEKSVDFLFRARKIFAVRGDIKIHLPAIYKLFHESMSVEYFSLAVPEKHRKNLLRYTVGIGGNLLQDGLSSPYYQNDFVDRAFEDRRSLIIDNIDSRRDLEADSLLISCGQKNLMVIPLVNYGRVSAVLTLGHPRPHHFQQKDLLAAEILASSLVPAIEGEIARRTGFERDRYLGALTAFQTALNKYSDIDSLVRAAAELIIDNVSTTVVRISTLNSEKTELFTRAVQTIRPAMDLQTKSVALSREMTPWHNLVISENRLLLINQNDSESCMDQCEAESLVIKGAHSALIVPIVVDDMTYGIIALGEMRHWERNSYDSAGICFCKGVAAAVANGIKLIQFGKVTAEPQTGRPDQLISGSSRLEIYRKFQTPLISLRGSVELLRRKGIGQTDDSDEIMSKIERSTEQMMSLFER